MSYNGSGTFTRTDGVRSGSSVWQSARDAGVAIEADDHDTHDNDIASGLSNCITKDGQTTLTANIPFSNFKITGLGSGTAANHASNMSQVQDNACKFGGTAGGSANALTFSLTPALASYASGMTAVFRANSTNTGATTININGLGAKAVKLSDGSALVGGELQAGLFYEVIYDGTATEWVLVNPSFVWQTWTPTLGASGAMTYGTTTTNHARYMKMGKLCFIQIDFTGTTGGTASNSLTFTLPFAPPTLTSDQGAGGGAVRDSAFVGGWVALQSASTTALVYKIDFSNYGLGADRAVDLSFFYETGA